MKDNEKFRKQVVIFLKLKVGEILTAITIIVGLVLLLVIVTKLSQVLNMSVRDVTFGLALLTCVIILTINWLGDNWRTAGNILEKELKKK